MIPFHRVHHSIPCGPRFHLKWSIIPPSGPLFRYDSKMRTASQRNPGPLRLETVDHFRWNHRTTWTGIRSIGWLTATSVVAAIGSGTEFSKGRNFATWLGLVPKQYSTGGKQRLLAISKRGNSYLRRLFIHGARSVLIRIEKQSSGLRDWVTQLAARAHKKVVAVALANKLARIAWAVLAKDEQYRPLQVADVVAV